LDDLPAPSSLMSSRWSRDNLVTCHPGVLYDGKIIASIDLQAVEYLVEDLRKQIGPVQTGACRMGVFTWDVICTGANGPFNLQIPLVVDEPGTRESIRSTCSRAGPSCS
jgi:hypothetical protein